MSFAKGVAALALLASATAFAQADYERERRWADEITPSILVGDPVQLALPSGRRFLAIHTPNPKAVAGVIVVHGLGLHPDWGLNGMLRSTLADQGYATLSVQMPVLAAGMPGDQYPPLFPEAAERIGVAVAFLRDKGHRKVAIVAHSMGSRMANAYLNRGGASAIDAWVSIGIIAPYELPAQFTAPVLDLYGEKDFPVVLKQAPERAAAIQKIRGSAQVEVPGADHFFNGLDAELTRQVRQFLDRRLR